MSGEDEISWNKTDQPKKEVFMGMYRNKDQMAILDQTFTVKKGNKIWISTKIGSNSVCSFNTLIIKSSFEVTLNWIQFRHLNFYP